jgi:hypothetical protein
MLALVDRFFEVDRTEARRRCDYDHVSQRYNLLVSIEADKLGLFSNCHSILHIAFITICECFVSAVQAVAEGICHGDELYILFGRQCLHGGTGASTTTTNNGNFDGVINGLEISCVRYQWHRHDSSR